MLGKNHIIVNTNAVVAFVSFGSFLGYQYRGPFWEECQVVWDTFVNYLYFDSFLPVGVWTFVSFVAYLFGTLLPDIDSPISILGKVMYLPVEHRTWTHTIWIFPLFFLCSLCTSLFFWITFGYFLHLLVDAVSAAGVCWFYPISNYKTYPSGAKVKVKHKCKLYYVGKPSEGTFLTIVTICGLFSVWFGFHTQSFLCLYHAVFA